MGHPGDDDAGRIASATIKVSDEDTVGKDDLQLRIERLKGVRAALPDGNRMAVGLIEDRIKQLQGIIRGKKNNNLKRKA